MSTKHYRAKTTVIDNRDYECELITLSECNSSHSVIEEGTEYKEIENDLFSTWLLWWLRCMGLCWLPWFADRPKVNTTLNIAYRGLVVVTLLCRIARVATVVVPNDRLYVPTLLSEMFVRIAVFVCYTLVWIAERGNLRADLSRVLEELETTLGSKVVEAHERTRRNASSYSKKIFMLAMFSFVVFQLSRVKDGRYSLTTIHTGRRVDDYLVDHIGESAYLPMFFFSEVFVIFAPAAVYSYVLIVLHIVVSGLQALLRHHENSRVHALSVASAPMIPTDTPMNSRNRVCSVLEDCVSDTKEASEYQMMLIAFSVVQTILVRLRSLWIRPILLIFAAIGASMVLAIVILVASNGEYPRRSQLLVPCVLFVGLANAGSICCAVLRMYVRARTVCSDWVSDGLNSMDSASAKRMELFLKEPLLWKNTARLSARTFGYALVVAFVNVGVLSAQFGVQYPPCNEPQLDRRNHSTCCSTISTLATVEDVLLATPLYCSASVILFAAVIQHVIPRRPQIVVGCITLVSMCTVLLLRLLFHSPVLTVVAQVCALFVTTNVYSFMVSRIFERPLFFKIIFGGCIVMLMVWAALSLIIIPYYMSLRSGTDEKNDPRVVILIVIILPLLSRVCRGAMRYLAEYVFEHLHDLTQSEGVFVFIVRIAFSMFGRVVLFNVDSLMLVTLVTALLMCLEVTQHLVQWPLRALYYYYYGGSESCGDVETSVQRADKYVGSIINRYDVLLRMWVELWAVLFAFCFVVVVRLSYEKSLPGTIGVFVYNLCIQLIGQFVCDSACICFLDNYFGTRLDVLFRRVLRNFWTFTITVCMLQHVWARATLPQLVVIIVEGL